MQRQVLFNRDKSLNCLSQTCIRNVGQAVKTKSCIGNSNDVEKCKWFKRRRKMNIWTSRANFKVMQKVNFMHEENGKYNRQISTHMRTGKIGIGMCMNYSKASVDPKLCTGRRGLIRSQHPDPRGILVPTFLICKTHGNQIYTKLPMWLARVIQWRLKLTCNHRRHGATSENQSITIRFPKVKVEYLFFI